MGVINFLKSTREEMKQVSWPSRRETITYTVAVLVISVVVAYVLGGFDLLFSKGIQFLINR